jgi:NADH:ubiquinone oxidoreductase subunit 4 (subunit M)
VGAIADMNTREVLAIAPICALCLWLGVMPQPVLELIRPDVDAVVALYETDGQGIEVAHAVTRIASDTAKSRVLSSPALNPEP